MTYHCRNTRAHNAHLDAFDAPGPMPATAACHGRDRCAVCRTLAWRDEMVEVKEMRGYEGKLRHKRCRF